MKITNHQIPNTRKYPITNRPETKWVMGHWNLVIIWLFGFSYWNFLRVFVVSLMVVSLLFPSPVHAMARKPKTFPIEVKVDFGPAEKAAYSGKLEVEKGTTPKEAVSQIFPVLSGKACCSLREITAIDGVKIDPAKNHWWTVSVNGSKKVKPNKTKLKKDDVLEWKFVEEAQ